MSSPRKQTTKRSNVFYLSGKVLLKKHTLEGSGDMDGEDSPCPSDSCGQLNVPSSEVKVRLLFKEDSPGLANLLDDNVEWMEELITEDEGDGDFDPSVEASGGQSYTSAGTARMFKLRRSMHQLASLRTQKEKEVLTAREELKLCHQKIQSVTEQRNDLEEEIERQKEAERSAVVFRLRAQHKHVCLMLHNEEELRSRIKAELKQHELELNKVELELGRLSLFQQEVREEEEAYKLHKAQKAVLRLQQQRKASQNMQLKRQHLINEQAAEKMKMEAEHQRKAEASRLSHMITDKYLKETIKRINQQKAEEEQQRMEMQKRRTQAAESLKSNIEANKKSIRLQQRRARAGGQKNEQQRERWQAEGINSIRMMHQQGMMKPKLKEFRDRGEFEKAEIETKLHPEDQRVTSKEPHKRRWVSTKERLRSLSQSRESCSNYQELSLTSGCEEPCADKDVTEMSSSPSVSDAEDLEDAAYRQEFQQSFAGRLNEPEVPGLWDWDSNVPRKFLTEETTSVLTKVKRGNPAESEGKLPVKVDGKEMKGPLFVSKPPMIHFKDFDVGKTYKKKIILTNSSSVTEHCKFLRVSSQLQDFISINFRPPGRLAAGMSCEMQAVFQPTFNKDLEGDVVFSAEAGVFSVPLRCTIKKCDLEVDSQFIDFGTYVVGQTTSRTFTLANKGALAIFFSLDTSAALFGERCRAQLTTQDVARDNQTSSVSTLLEDSQLKHEELPEALLQKQSDDPLPEDIPETCASAREDAQMDQSHSDCSDLTLGKVRDGELGPFESIKLKVIFTPTIPGEARLKFYIKFSDSTIKPIPIHVTGVAVTIPVWVAKPSVDLRICLFDHLYQDIITVQSRASTTLKLTFEVCPELRKHMKILPKTGFIQAQSTFNGQLKFLPRSSLSKDAHKYFDADTGVLEVPVVLQIAGQVKPVQFIVNAIVTTSDLQFDLSEVDFGDCSIYYPVEKSVGLTNLSLLPQEFGFVGVPECIDVQPNDGFGTLLPQETLRFDLIFCPTVDKDYSFQLTCKSEYNRDFRLSCRGTGVHPPLELSHSLVQFGDTAVGDCSSSVLFLTNHEVTKGKVTPVPPRLFSFALPGDCEISISPAAGRLQPGERSPILVTFRPALSDQAIRDEAQRLLQREMSLCEEEMDKKKLEVKKTMVIRKGKRAPVSPKDGIMSSIPQTDQQTELLNPADIQPGSWLYEEARTTLLCHFPQCFNEYIVPCFVSDGIPPEEDLQEPPPWSHINTLYLKMWCPAVRPPLVVTSNIPHNTVDFDRVIVGEKVIKRMTIQNICQDSLDLRSSLLDLNGSFSLLNALRCLKPGQKHTLVLAFRPSQEKKYCERLDVYAQTMTLAVVLQGEGVVPAVTCSHQGGILDFGYVLEKESTSQVLKLQNGSLVTVGFRVQLASLCPSLSEDEADSVTGTQNYSGMGVFSVSPAEGSISPEQSVDVVISFQPDHPSVNYRDRLSIKLRNQMDVCVMDLRGAASSHNMYLYGGDPLKAPAESLLPPLISSQFQLTAVMGKAPVPILVTLWARYSAGVLIPAVRQLQLGCISSSQFSEKGGEFLWDDVASLQELGFSLQPSKGTIEPGQKHTVSITWTPNRGYKPFEVVQTCVSVWLKGAQTSVYRVTLMALVSNT
ncbi:cilia- and flagella-associated protein 74 isoform X5 [Takifugu flavidus]|uniref:cilia- and flagella-associated protein 74 isoform X5 n=1 Tax=Takifugu flavidus TaxID=433684 RepID=UPI0025441F53|nr:cilia- and flagella-associated protein 74 isoform X5 [Takifugu flavidus]